MNALHCRDSKQPRQLTQIELKYITDIYGLILDTAAQKIAVGLSKKYIGSAFSSILKKANFFLCIFDPFPPPAGSSEDMINISLSNNYDVTSLNQVSIKNLPCN